MSHQRRPRATILSRSPLAPFSSIAASTMMSRRTRSLSEQQQQQQQSVTADDECNLTCHNGGECVMGKALYGFTYDWIEDEDVSPLAKQKFSRKHCVCPRDWTGLHCEIKLILCSKGQMHCFNGKECELAKDDRGKPLHHCECDGVESDFSQPYAVHFCGDVSTVWCSQEANVRHSFCKNGGKCRGTVRSAEEV